MAEQGRLRAAYESLQDNLSLVIGYVAANWDSLKRPDVGELDTFKYVDGGGTEHTGQGIDLSGAMSLRDEEENLGYVWGPRVFTEDELHAEIAGALVHCSVPGAQYKYRCNIVRPDGHRLQSITSLPEEKVLLRMSSAQVESRGGVDGFVASLDKLTSNKQGSQDNGRHGAGGKPISPHLQPDGRYVFDMWPAYQSAA
jgi:hypothetical protein